MTDSGRASGAKGAVQWLAEAAPDPGACRREWERAPASAALLPAGRRWDVLIVPAGLGRPTLDVLCRLVERPGPVLSDIAEERTGFFVPPGTVSRWLGTGVRGAGRGTWIVVPHPRREAGGMRWLVPPDGSGVLTDPAVLELAMHEAAAGLVEAGEGTGTPWGLGEPGEHGELGVREFGSGPGPSEVHRGPRTCAEPYGPGGEEEPGRERGGEGPGNGRS